MPRKSKKGGNSKKENYVKHYDNFHDYDVYVIMPYTTFLSNPNNVFIKPVFIAQLTNGESTEYSIKINNMYINSFLIIKKKSSKTSNYKWYAFMNSSIFVKWEDKFLELTSDFTRVNKNEILYKGQYTIENDIITVTDNKTYKPVTNKEILEILTIWYNEELTKYNIKQTVVDVGVDAALTSECAIM